MILRHILSAGILALALCAASAQAAIIHINLTSFGANPVPFAVTLDDETMAGFLTVSGSVGPDPVGDIRGLFLDLDADLSAFDLTNDVIDDLGLITNSAFNTVNLGMGNNVQGEIVNLGFSGDLAFSFGSPGMGGIDVQTFTLRLAGLSVSDVTGVAARVTSVGPAGGPRNGSDKLFLPASAFPVPDPQAVPEPGAISLLGLALVGLALLRRRAAR